MLRDLDGQGVEDTSLSGCSAVAIDTDISKESQ